MISVIVPVYNTEKYLNRCIKSIISQKESDLEIILVDDCSTDKSPVILDDWEKKDSRIRVIHKNNNTGVSNTRNIGLKEAKGEYIAFVDSDDWIEEDMLSSMVKCIEQSGADIVFGGYNRIVEDDIIKVVPKEKTGTVVSIEDALLHSIPQQGIRRYDLYIWDKLYRKSSIMINDGIIKFDSRFKFGEDVVWLIQVMQNCNSVVFWNGSGYNYFTEREGNTWTSLINYESMEYCESAFITNVLIYKMLHNYGGQVENNAFQRVIYYQWFAIRTAIEKKDNYKIRKYSKRYIRSVFAWLINNRTLIGVKWAIIHIGLFIYHKIRYLLLK